MCFRLATPDCIDSNVQLQHGSVDKTVYEQALFAIVQ